MSSRGKKKTTMAKLNREARLRERRSNKAARKEARRNGLDDHSEPSASADPSEDPSAEQPPAAPEPVLAPRSE